MNVQGINSNSMLAVWELLIQQQSRQQASQTGDASGSASSDSIAISQQGFAALLATQQAGNTGGWQLTDEQAAKIGAVIQERNPDLFKKIDTDGNGTLSAAELKAGKDQIQAARAAEIGSKIQAANPDLFKALDTDGDGTLSPDELKADRSLLQGEGGNQGAGATDGTRSSGVHHHHHHHHHGVNQSQDAAALNQSSGSGSSADSQTSSSGSGQVSSLGDLQSNNLYDVLQILLSQISAQNTQ